MQFENYGPFDMPVDQHGDFAIGDDAASKLFFRKLDAEHPGISEGCGCYIFAMHSAGGTTPWYVGKANKISFGRECFNANNMRRMALNQRHWVSCWCLRVGHLPVAGNGAVLDFGWTFADRNRIHDLSRQPAGRSASFRIAQAPPRPKMPSNSS